MTLTLAADDLLRLLLRTPYGIPAAICDRKPKKELLRHKYANAETVTWQRDNDREFTRVNLFITQAGRDYLGPEYSVATAADEPEQNAVPQSGVSHNG